MPNTAKQTNTWIDQTWFKTLTTWTNIFYQVPDALIKSIPIVLFSASIWPLLLILCCNIINNILTALNYLNSTDKAIYHHNTRTNSAWDVVQLCIVAAMLVSCGALYLYKAESFTGWAANLGLMSAYAFWIHWAAVLIASLAVIDTITKLYQAAKYAGWSVRRMVTRKDQLVKNVMHTARPQTDTNNEYEHFEYYYNAQDDKDANGPTLLTRVKDRKDEIASKIEKLLVQINNHISSNKKTQVSLHEPIPNTNTNMHHTWYSSDPNHVYQTYKPDPQKSELIPVMQQSSPGKAGFLTSMLGKIQATVDSKPWKGFFTLINGLIDACITFFTFTMIWNIPALVAVLLASFNMFETCAFALKYYTGDDYTHTNQDVTPSFLTNSISYSMYLIIQISALIKSYCKLLLGLAVTAVMGLSAWACWSAAFVYAAATWLRNAPNGLYSGNTVSNLFLNYCHSDSFGSPARISSAKNKKIDSAATKSSCIFRIRIGGKS